MRRRLLGDTQHVTRRGSFGLLLAFIVVPVLLQNTSYSVDASSLKRQQIEVTFSNAARQANTPTSFEKTQTQEQEELPFTTETQTTDEWFTDESEVMQVGTAGMITRTFETTLWNNEEVARALIKEEVVEPVAEIVKQGTKQRVSQLASDLGDLSYTSHFTMWSTSYDGNCLGCTGRTYLGTSVKHGTCAVDPSVIPLGSRVYIPGYGICRAEDIGGAIKGNKIDLGFEDVRSGWWSSRYTDVYLLE